MVKIKTSDEIESHDETLKTPSQKRKQKESSTLINSSNNILFNAHTPRRSSRKHIKTVQYYEETATRTLRSSTKKAVKILESLPESSQSEMSEQPTKSKCLENGANLESSSRRQRRNTRTKVSTHCLDEVEIPIIKIDDIIAENDVDVKVNEKDENYISLKKNIKERNANEVEIKDFMDNINTKENTNRSQSKKKKVKQRQENKAKNDSIIINLTTPMRVQDRKQINEAANTDFSNLKINDTDMEDLGLCILSDEDQLLEQANAVKENEKEKLSSELKNHMLVEKKQLEIEYKIETDETNISTSTFTVSDNEETHVMKNSSYDKMSKQLSNEIIPKVITENQLINCDDTKGFRHNKLESSNQFPTPFKKKPNLHFNKLDNLDNTMAANDIGRNLRKRSISLQADCNSTSKLKMVSFHSPGNQTAIIEDFDLLIKENIKKATMKKNDEELSYDKNTKRCIRVKSCDEIRNLQSGKKWPRTVLSKEVTSYKITPVKINSPTTDLIPAKFSRKRVPNFSAIHQKHFDKMENLVDYVTRRKERSKNLINSTSKQITASVQKSDSNSQKKTKGGEKSSSVKNIYSLESMTKLTRGAVIGKDIITSNIAENMSDQSLSFDTGKENHDQHKAYRSLIPITKIMKTKTILNQTELTSPKLMKPIILNELEGETKLASVTSKALKSVTTKLNRPVETTKIEKKGLIVSHGKQPSNLNKILSKPTERVITDTKSTFDSIDHTSGMKISDQLSQLHDKTTTRLERHKNMFKGREIANHTKRTKNETFIRGVRSNRRFELQMQHRRNLEQ